MSDTNNVDALVALFTRIGLDDKKANETVKNKKLSHLLAFVIQQSKPSEREDEREEAVVDKHIGALLYILASTYQKGTEANLAKIARLIGRRELKLESQVSAALGFIAKQDTFTEEAFNDACGLGVLVSPEDIQAVVHAVISKHKEALIEERYGFNQGQLLKEMKEVKNMKWVEGRLLKEALDTGLEALLGPRTEADKLLKPKKKGVEAATAARELPSTVTEISSMRVFEGEVLRFHKPGENPQISEELRLKHLAATGGRVITRFPPEPNGYLHIGHAKAINFNFKYAQLFNGITYLRYDDTNPEAEEEKYFTSIAESIAWLGFTPYKVTHSSDYFQYLYECAVTLIKKSKAYVCHQTPEEINKSRGGVEKGPRTPSPWRDRPIEESLRLFEDMKAGKFKEGEAILRLKQDIYNPNPFMWDLVAYRVLYTPHVKTGTTWCIYPMYDFTHCLCDSVEDITHSLCTTEFILAREAYYWVCDNVGVYKPVQWEYGRLSLTNTLLSKRKLTKLVSEGIVKGWDDPRLYTLAGIRRRGFTPKSVNNFVERLGITTALTTVDVKTLEACVREDLNETAPRRMAILQPLLLEIENLNEDHCEWIEVLDFPHLPEGKNNPKRVIPFTKRIYIDKDDFMIEDTDPNFYRLTLTHPVGLYRAGIVTVTKVLTDSKSGELKGLKVRKWSPEEVERSKGSNISSTKERPITHVQWVAEAPSLNSPLKVEVRLYSNLFKSRNPSAAPGGWMSDIAPESLEVISEAMVDVRLIEAKVEDKFQFQRIGYFCVDPDSSVEEKKLVFNRTVSLKEDPYKP